MIKFPKRLQKDLTKYFNLTDPFLQSTRSALNYIHDNRNNFTDLFEWLFNDQDFNNNQVKFANYLVGSDYEFIDSEYNYMDETGQLIGYNEYTKQFTLGVKADFIRNNLTRDEILDSSFDVNKLTEVPYNGEEKENDN